jgi:hypothetical protein
MREHVMKIALTAFACLFAVSSVTAFADPPPGPAKNPPPKRNSVCLNPSDIDHLSYPDDKTILFHMRGGKVRIWRNDLPRACNGMKFQGGIAYEIRGGVICSNMQTFTVIERGIPCMLGAFTPYTPPPKDAAEPAKSGPAGPAGPAPRP